MKRFYHDWYRPDLMGIVAVGDYPVDSIAALIKSRFGAMRNPVKERPRTDAPVPTVPGTRMVAITDPEQPTEADRAAHPSSDHSLPDRGRRTAQPGHQPVQHHRGAAPSGAGRKPDVPFVGASFGPSGFIRDLQIFQVGVSRQGGQERRRVRGRPARAAPPRRARSARRRTRSRQGVAACADANRPPPRRARPSRTCIVEAYINAFLRGEALVSATRSLRAGEKNPAHRHHRRGQRGDSRGVARQRSLHPRARPGEGQVRRCRRATRCSRSWRAPTP